MKPSLSKSGLLLAAALAFYLLGALFFFRAAVFSDRIQLCTDILQSTYPWALARDGAYKPVNPALSDQCTYFYPVCHYTGRFLREGRIPLWTPCVLGGAPYMGNLSSAVFYPVNLLLAVMPLAAWLLFQSIFKVTAAGLFMFLFLRKLKLSGFSSFFGGAVYAFGGFTVLWVLSHLTSVMLVMPLLFYATERFLERRSGPNLALVSLLLAVQFLGAQPEISLCLSASWVIYILFRARKETGLFNKGGLALLGSFAGAGVLALGLICFLLLPFLEYLRISYGLILRRTEAEAISQYGGLDPLYSPGGIVLGLLFLLLTAAAILLFRRGRRPFTALLAGALAGGAVLLALQSGLMVSLKPYLLIHLFPDLYGNPLEGVVCGGGAAFPEFNGGYVGILPFLLALTGLVGFRKRAPVGIFTALFLISSGAVYGIPFIYHLVRSLPLFEMSPSGRIIAVSAFSLTVLSAFGMEFLLHCAGGFKEHKAALFRALGALVVLAAAVGLFGWGLMTPLFVPGGAAPQPEEIVLSSPQPGQTLSSKDGLLIRGAAGTGVKHVRFYLNGLGIGEVALTEGDRTFSFDYPLNRTREGIYRLVVDTGNGRFSTVSVVVAHCKTITGKNLLVVVISLLVFGLLFLTPRFLVLRGVLALAVACADLALLGADFNPASDPATVFPDTEVTDFLTAHNGPFRILPEDVILQPNTNLFYEYQILRGYDGLELPEYNELVNWMKQDLWVDPHHYDSKTLDYENPILDLLGVKYIVSLDDLGAIPGLKPVLAGPVNIFENLEALPKAFFAGRWLNIKKIERLLGEDPAAALDYVKPALTTLPKGIGTAAELTEFIKKHFDYREWILFKEEIDFRGGGSGRAEIEAYEPEHIRLRCRVEGEAILMVTDNWFPGWEAEVDGRPRPILRATQTFRALLMEEGEHVVEFFYRPASVSLGWKISLAALIVVLLLFLYPVLTTPLRSLTGRGRLL